MNEPTRLPVEYPDGMHTTIAQAITEERKFDVRTATLQQLQHGLTKAALHKEGEAGLR